MEKFSKCTPNFEEIDFVLESLFFGAASLKFFGSYQLDDVSLVHLLPWIKINLEVNISFTLDGL